MDHAQKRLLLYRPPTQDSVGSVAEVPDDLPLLRDRSASVKNELPLHARLVWMQEVVSSAAVLGSAIGNWLSDQVGHMLLGNVPFTLRAPAKAVAQSASEVITVRQGYIDPTPDTGIFQIAAHYGFTTLMINVGTSYFRRLAASNYAMMEVGLSSPHFCLFVLPFEEYPPNSGPKPLVGAIHAKYLPTNEAWLTLIHMTCIYIAAKNLEYVPCKNMLQAIMGHIYGVDPGSVAAHLLSELELECMSALDWRLGPFYQTDS